jgi:hypothetical protein
MANQPLFFGVRHVRSSQRIAGSGDKTKAGLCGDRVRDGVQRVHTPGKEIAQRGGRVEQPEHDVQIGTADIQVDEDDSIPHTRQHQAKIACHDTFAHSTFAGRDGNNHCHRDDPPLLQPE